MARKIVGSGAHRTRRTSIEQRLTIEHGATNVLADSNSMAVAAPEIIRTVCETLGWACGSYRAFDPLKDTMVCVGTWGAATDGVGEFLKATRQVRQSMRPVGLIRRTWLEGAPVWVRDVTADETFRRAPVALKAGLRSAFAFPVKAGPKVIGVMEFFSREIHQPDADLLDCTQYIGRQIGQFCQRTEAQERLREIEAQFQSTIELAAIGIAHVGAEGRFLHVNRWLCELLGYTREELLGMSVKQISHPDDKDITDEVRATLRAGQINSFQMEKRYVRKDGSVVWVGLTVSVKRAPSGEPLDDISIVEDISARKQAEEALRLSEQRFRGLVNLSSDWYWEQDAEARFTWSSNELGERTGPLAQQLVGRRRWELPGLTPLSGNWEEHKAVIAARQPYRDFEYARVAEDGTAIYRSISGEPVFDDRGVFRGYVGIGRDITQRKRAEVVLRLEHTVTLRLADADSASTALTAVMQAMCESEGWSCGEYWGRDEKADVLRFGGFWNAYGPEIQHHFEKAHEYVFAPGVGLAGRVWQSGEPMWIADVATDPRMLRKGLAREAGLRGAFLFPVAAAGELHGVFAFWSRAIREPDERTLQATRVIGSQIGQFLRRKQSEERIQYLATHDGLTGLPNRILFSQLLNFEIASAGRHERKFAVLFIDLDRFKEINDSLGHEAGDQLLREISARLKSAVRTSDVVARLGGDEFVVLLREVGDGSQVAAIARKILSAVIKPLTISGQECRVTASLGIAMFPEDAQDEPSLMKRADIAMYLAKEEGKNNFQFYTEGIKP